MSSQRAVKMPVKSAEVGRSVGKARPAALPKAVDDVGAALVKEALVKEVRPAAAAAAAEEMAAAVGVSASGGSDDERAVKLFREDPALDRRIIEGMLRDRGVFLDQMAVEGLSAGAVLRRAAELGLSEALIRQVKGVAADLAGERPGRRPAPSSLGARTCLSCDRIFLSSGPGNRLCMRCRGGDAGLAQL